MAIASITSHIEGLEKHVTAMYEELVGEFEGKKVIQAQSDQKDKRLAVINSEITRLKGELKEREELISAFKRELGNIICANCAPKEFEEATKLLYRKYVVGDAIKGDILRPSTLVLSQAVVQVDRPPLNADDLMEDSGEGTYRQKVLPRVAKHDPRHRLSAEKNLNDKGIRKYQRELEALVVQLEEVHKEKDFYLSEMNKLRQQVALLSRPVEKANDRGMNYGFSDTAHNGSFEPSPLRLSLDRSFSPYFEDRNNTEGERDMRVVGNIPTAKKYI